MRSRILIYAFAFALGLLAGAPAAADASTVTLEGGALVMRAAPGEDILRAESDDTGTKVELSGGTITSYPSVCAPAMWSSGVECSPQAGGVRIEGGGGDDTVNVYSGIAGTPMVSVEDGEGNDTLSAHSHSGTSRLDGGTGNDELGGSEQADGLFGGPGDDDLAGNGGADELRGADGSDTLEGDFTGAAAADVIDGGAGQDAIDGDWMTRGGAQPPIAVSLDGRADDGRPGEGDNVTAIERIHLNAQATLVAGSDAVDFQAFNYSGGGSKLVGSPAADRLRSYDSADVIEAGDGDDWIEAGLSDDVITPGAGRDTVNADAGSGSCNFLVCRIGSGNDTVNARDGEADSIDCGVGTDVANVDANDTVSGCETVNVPGGPVGGGGPQGGDGGPVAGKRCKVPRVKRGRKLRPVKRALRKAGCRTKVVRVRSRRVRAGRVVRVSPKAGRKLRRGATVRVYVARSRR